MAFRDPGDPQVLDLKRRRGDTFPLIVRFMDHTDPDNPAPMDVSAMDLRWVADSRKFPPDDDTEVFDINGSFVTDGTDGEVAFSPTDADVNIVGTFFQDFCWLDGANKKRTIASGKLKMTQDIAKG